MVLFQFALVRSIDHPTMSPQTLLRAVVDRSSPLATTARGFFISVGRIFGRLYHRAVARLRLRQRPARQRAADSSFRQLRNFLEFKFQPRCFGKVDVSRN